MHMDLLGQPALMLGVVAPAVANNHGIDWGQFGALISAVGALGIAAFGVVEALGKAFAISFTIGGRTVSIGLPYVGFGAVKRMMKPLQPALLVAYGDGYMQIIAQQYRADRSKGRAPDTIQDGVKLGLPFMQQADAARLISQLWKLDDSRSNALAVALSADQPPTPAGATAPDTSGAQLLVGRFATALNERVSAAFELAEERYEAAAKLLAAIAAVALAYAFNMQAKLPLWEVIFVGLVAVPLAPVAKDLSTSLQNALTAFKAIPTKPS